MGHMRFIIYC